MKYILIVIFHVNAGATMHHVEFDSKAACEATQKWLLANADSHGYSQPLNLVGCVPK